MKTIVRQYRHRPNMTELGQGNTHETYMLINANVDLSSIFPSGTEVEVEDTKTRKKYSLKSAQGREFRVNQMGGIYRDHGVVPGDEIFITKIEKNGNNKIYATVNKYHRIVLIVGNNGVEVINEDRLSGYRIDAHRNYHVNINKGDQTSLLSIKFKESKKKRADSPTATDFFEVKDGDATLSNGTHYLTISDKITLCKIDKCEYTKVEYTEDDIIMTDYEKNIRDILLANHNIILHGAPGTGKTYLAKKIAEALGAEFNMVQFHPSYDYTDFVEGLRPYDNGSGTIIFKRKDGTFKEFCKRAFSHPNIANEDFVSDEELTAAWNYLISTANNNVVQMIQSRGKAKNVKTEDGKLYFTTSEAGQKEEIVTLEKVRTKFANYDYSLPLIMGLSPEQCKKDISSQGSDAWALLHKLCKIMRTRQFIFLIDEINRGDLSKIFGELFFAIDPGYRGIKGKIDTQYQNLIDKNGTDPFESGFYVPENVYIIGTMNDIDRSVESMDFAMRRRFQFIEVTAEKRAEGMGLKTRKQDGDAYEETAAYKRMTNLNNCIISKEIGLSKAYQIGGSYFLTKNEKGDNVPTEDFESLWEYRLEGLLREYLRGEEERDIKRKIDTLKNAYELTVQYNND